MREKPPITTIEDLLEALVIEYGSQKYLAMVQCFDRAKPEVIECFDDGKGHSNAFTRDHTALAVAVFQEALDKRYITGKLEPGYVSKTEFTLTDTGRDVHYARLDRIRKEERAAQERAEAEAHVPEQSND